MGPPRAPQLISHALEAHHGVRHQTETGRNAPGAALFCDLRTVAVSQNAASLVPASNKLDWVGNIIPEPPQGNLPRHPLVVAETDEERYTMPTE